MDDLLVEHVLRAVESVPEGRVVSYGRIAELVGGTARQVGSVMRHSGNNVAWWRVTNSYGDLPRHLRESAAPHWDAEGIDWKPNGLGCRIADHLVDEKSWLVDYERAVSDLPPYTRPGHSPGPPPHRTSRP